MSHSIFHGVRSGSFRSPVFEVIPLVVEMIQLEMPQEISPAFNVSDQTSPVCCAISDQRVLLQTSPAFGFAFRLLLHVLRDVVLEFSRSLALSVVRSASVGVLFLADLSCVFIRTVGFVLFQQIPHLAKFSPIPFSVSRTIEHCSAASSSENSHPFRPPFFTFEVALDSSREALSIDIPFGGCCWLERDRKAAPVIRSAVRLICSGFNQFSRALLVVIVAQNQDLSGCRDVLLAFLRTGAYCLAGSCVLVYPLDSYPGFLGYSAGRGDDPAGDAPGAGRRSSHDAAPVGHTLAGTRGDADCANVERWCAACRALVSEEARRWLAIAAISRRSGHLLADVMVLAAVRFGRWLRAGRAMHARSDAVVLRRRVRFFVDGGRRPAAAPAIS
ncbi:hypothetical protein F511_41871 [Dorcoceras hygrometricum]|uniref:Uncharacterized protein n=1 Tax=Dorcoceras hygrometricum TaxID=472368 RepID=A0A2Z7BN32_9LAMI|nr:hypothetical protein F511_41871 [Dorcoceras hygrometricum]